MRRSSYLSILAAAVLVYGCSLINSPEELLEAANEASGGANATGGANGTGGMGDGSAGETSTGGAAPTAPTRGLFVFGARNQEGARVLSALTTNTAEELARIELPVAAIAYDEAPGRYVWFVFTASKFPADPTRTADLEVRRFDDASKTWTVLSKASGLPPPRPDQLVVLNNRLAYLSHKVVSGSAAEALTVLDTSDLTQVEELATRVADEGEQYIGLVGTRGSDTNPDADGGSLDLMIGRNCDADCELFVQPVFVAGNLVNGAGAVIDHYRGAPRFVAGRTQAKVYAAMYSTRPAEEVEVRVFAPDEPAVSTVFPLNELSGEDISAFDLVECSKAGIVRTAQDTSLVSFHLESGFQQTTDLETLGALAYAEPFAGSAIAFTFGPGLGGAGNDAAPPLRAFQVEPSGSDDLAVNERSLWNPPDDLEPLTGAARYPEAWTCD
jgi:hypothetical protein